LLTIVHAAVYYPSPVGSDFSGAFHLWKNHIHASAFVGQISHDPGAIEEMSMALKTMSIEKLVELKGQIEAALSSKITEERRALETKLASLTHFGGGGTKGSKALAGRGGRGAVPPKYRNSENPAETWAGRGLKPRWLTAAIKSGKKAEDFLIVGSRTSSKANGRKKPRKARK
jgi:DNA-binding protein H-NS